MNERRYKSLKCGLLLGFVMSLTEIFAGGNLVFFRTGQDMDIDLLFKMQRKGGALGAQDEPR